MVLEKSSESPEAAEVFPCDLFCLTHCSCVRARTHTHTHTHTFIHLCQFPANSPVRIFRAGLDQLRLDDQKVKVAQSCPTLCNRMDYIVHGVLQARILEWVAIPFSRGSSQSRDRT